MTNDHDILSKADLLALKEQTLTQLCDKLNLEVEKREGIFAELNENRDKIREYVYLAHEAGAGVTYLAKAVGCSRPTIYEYVQFIRIRNLRREEFDRVQEWAKRNTPKAEQDEITKALAAYKAALDAEAEHG